MRPDIRIEMSMAELSGLVQDKALMPRLVMEPKKLMADRNYFATIQTASGALVTIYNREVSR